MTNLLVNFLALVLYLVAPALLWRGLVRGQAIAGSTKVAILGLVTAAVILHAVILYTGIRLDGGVNLALTAASSLVAWIVACLYLLVAISRPVENLGIVILPLAGLTVLIEWLWPGQTSISVSSPPQAVHIVVSLLAYSLLCIATVQSLMLLFQEHKLRQKQPRGFIRALAPMQTMEELMFQMIGLGFLLLTLTLITGVFFSEALFGKPFKFTHHMVLAAIAWLVYATLLLGRWQLGWRGRTAIRWTLGGFSLLVLAYFGSKFVLEVLLGR